MKFKCDSCEETCESHDGGYIMPQGKDQYCEECFTEKFQCEDCGGFKNKFAMAVYDGGYCECD